MIRNLTSSTGTGTTSRPPSSDVRPRPGQEALFAALDKLAPASGEPEDRLEPQARTALDAQRAWEEKIEDEHQQMRQGTVIPLPPDAEMDSLRLLRGMDRLREDALPREQKQAMAAHLKDVIDRAAGLPILVRGRGHVRYR